jgi:hypothetical protein
MAPLVKHTIGTEGRPLVVVEDFAEDVDALISYANSGEPFHATAGDLYPGVSTPRVIFSAFSITTTEPQHLRPVQRVPHFDTSAANQLAIVHYLCGPEHGGTAFYRHRSTGFETISHERLHDYAKMLKREVMTEHPPPAKYMDGDDALFIRIANYEARCNRALIYPSNVLHSGNIRGVSPLDTPPRNARLTLNSFVRFE